MTLVAISGGKVMETLPDLDTFVFRKFEITEYTPNFVGDALFQADGVVDTLTSQAPPGSIPEPGTYLLLASSLLLGLTLRRRSGSIVRTSSPTAADSSARRATSYAASMCATLPG